MSFGKSVCSSLPESVQFQTVKPCVYFAPGISEGAFREGKSVQNSCSRHVFEQIPSCFLLNHLSYLFGIAGPGEIGDQRTSVFPDFC